MTRIERPGEGCRALGAGVRPAVEIGFMLPLSKFKRLDVRGMLRRGVEPYPEIRKRVDSLLTDEGLILRAPFLPSPLIEKLGSEGFQSRVERGPAGDWIVYFWRKSASLGQS